MVEILKPKLESLTEKKVVPGFMRIKEGKRVMDINDLKCLTTFVEKQTVLKLIEGKVLTYRQEKNELDSSETSQECIEEFKTSAPYHYEMKVLDHNKMVLFADALPLIKEAELGVLLENVKAKIEHLKIVKKHNKISLEMSITYKESRSLKLKIF